MTLKDYRSSRYEELFLAVIQKEIDWDDAANVMLTIPGFPHDITAIDALKIAVEEAIAESDEPMTDENKRQIEEEVKQQISTHLEQWYPVPLLKCSDGYIDLSEMEKLTSDYRIKCLIPFKEYYTEEQYSFEEDANGPYLYIDMEIFEKFVEDFEKGKFN